MTSYYMKNNKTMPGKGMLVLNEITNANMLLHNYQVLYNFYDSPSSELYNIMVEEGDEV